MDITTADDKALKAYTTEVICTSMMGNGAQIDELEDRAGSAVSSILDGLWSEWAHRGNLPLAQECGRAFNHITGR